jgi:hypothetical protein
LVPSPRHGSRIPAETGDLNYERSSTFESISCEGRNPNDPQDTDYDFWLTKLNNFTQPGDDILVRVQKAEMVKAFIVSTEYRKRFGTP